MTAASHITELLENEAFVAKPSNRSSVTDPAVRLFTDAYFLVHRRKSVSRTSLEGLQRYASSLP